MADWFETRFREPAAGELPDPAFSARVRALVVEEWRTDAAPAGSVITKAPDHEGDVIMLETEDRPIDRAPEPRRRPPGQWLLAAAAVAVLAVLAAVVVGGGDDEDKIDTAPSAPSVGEPPLDMVAVMEAMGEGDTLEPGSYFIDPDGDPATPLRVVYDVAAEGWVGWIGAAKFTEDGHIGLSITTVTNLTRDACLNQRPADPPVGPTVDDLATALTQLAPFVVSSAPRDVTAFGYAGKHLQLTIPTNLDITSCQSDEVHSWFAPLLGGSFWGYSEAAGHVEDFWILDVEGTRLVIQTNQSPGSPAQDLEEREAIFDSIRIEP